MDKSRYLARVPGPPWLLAVMAIFAIQLSSALSVGLIDTVGPGGAAWLRLSMGAVLMILLAPPPLRSIRSQDLPVLLVLGAAMGLMNVAFLAAIERIPLGTAVAIEFLGPLTVAAVRSRSMRTMAWPALALAGVVLVTEPWQGDIDIAGVGFALLAALGWGAYIVLLQRVGDRFTGSGVLSITLPVAAITAATIGVPQAAGNIDLTVVAIALGLALLAPVLLFVLELAALRRMTTPAFGTLMAIEPAIALLLGLVVLSQMPTVIQCLGIIVVVLAGATAQHGGRREPLANTGAMPIHTQQVEEGSPHNKDATDAVQSSSGNTAAESVQHSAVNTADSSCDEVLRASHEDRSQRQPKASTPTPGPDVRVCFVGDSFVAGTGDPTGLGWVGRVTAQAISRGMRVTTYNLGVRRETSVQISHRILAEVKPRLSDVDAPRVVVSFGVNDTVLEHGQSRVQAHEAVTALVNIHQSLAPLPLLMVGPPAIDDNAQNARLEHLNELLRTTAEAHNIAFIDTFHATVTNHSWRDEVRNGDGYHPSANGYQLLAETVVNPLTDWLHDGNHPEF